MDILKKYIVSGYPVLVRQWRDRKKAYRHYRVVVGYDDHKALVIYHDPKVRANMEMDYELFAKLWNVQVASLDWSTKNLMIVIGKI